MSDTRRALLRIVPLEEIRPHEVADPAREARIERRLREDGILRDPLIVGTVHDVAGYVLLDGTNRLRALHAIGGQAGLVQVVDYTDVHAVQLRTWCHHASVSVASLAHMADSIPGTTIEALPPLSATEMLVAGRTLAVILNGTDGIGIVRTSEHPHSRPEQLGALVRLYEDRMVRVDCDPTDVEERARTACMGTSGSHSLIAFPPMSRSQVVTMAMRGVLIPAGITRHSILTGRALRVNLPLDLLRHGSNPEHAASALQGHLRSLHPRTYEEPTILFDS